MASAAQAISCKKFTDFLIRRNEHFDLDIIKDVRPTDGWIGHVSSGPWPAGTGVTHQFDRLHGTFPDLSQPWTDMTAGNCLGTPCDPTEQKIGFGYTQESYALQTKSYGTDLFCFDLIMSADRAKEQFSALLTSLRESTSIIYSDRLKNEALRIAKRKMLLALNLPAFTYTVSADGMTITPSALPTSRLTVPALMRQYQPLILEGAGGSMPEAAQMLELVTDEETAWRLVQGNPELRDMYRFSDFSQGGKLYKYGVTDAIGNYAIRVDRFPLRFLINGATLVRVLPFTNIAASGGFGGSGIRQDINEAYLNAPVQVDFIWNRGAMRSMTRTPDSVNPMMPFAKRDFAGKWQFVMDNLGADSNGCVIENSRRNKGKFIADFANGTKAEHPEWVIAFLSLRDRPKFVVEIADFTAATYAAQDYTSDNDVCTFVLDLVHGAISNITIAASSITCNGVNISHPLSGTLADQAAVVVWLNANVGELGVWSAFDATTIRLTGSVCSSVTVPLP